MEPQLAVSELFLLQYGISMKPGDQGQPGPSTKAARLGTHRGSEKEGQG